MIAGARSSASFHSEHRQVPWLREIDPDPLFEIHPETAQKLGIREGDMVWIENWLGKCKSKAKITPVIHPKVVMSSYGWWYPEKPSQEPDLFGVWEVNVNQLIPMGHTGKAGYGCPLKSILCKVNKREGE